MHFHLDRNSEKWTIYSVKIFKCESFLIALQRNSKKWTFLWRKMLKSRPFLIAYSTETLKSDIFIA